MTKLLSVVGVCWLLFIGAAHPYARSQDTVAVGDSPAESTPQAESTETATTRMVARVDAFIKHLNEGNYPEATAEFESLATEHWSQDFDEYLGYRLDKDTELADLKAALTSAGEANPQDAIPHRLLGYLCVVDKYNVLAMEQLDLAIGIDPSNPIVFLMRGTCREFQSENSKGLSKAVEDISEAIRLNPDAAAFYLLRGEWRVGGLKDQAGYDDIDKAMKLGSDPCKCFMIRAELRSHFEDYRASVDDCTSAIETYENQSPEKRQKYVDYTQFEMIESPLAHAYTNRGLLKGRLKDYRGCIDDLDKAIPLTKDKDSKVDLLVTRGTARMRIDNTKAIADFDEAIRLDPNSAEAIFRRGEAYHLGMKLQAAVDDFEAFTRLEPDNAIAYYQCGVALVDLKKYPEAIERLDMALKLDPKDEGSYHYRGMANHKLGKYKLAVIDYSQSIVLDLTNDDSYRRRAYSKIQLGDFAGALADFDRAIELDENSTAAISAKSILLSTCSDESLRDNSAAWELANVCLRIDSDSYEGMIARACSHAGSEKFKSAIEWEEKAMKHQQTDNESEFTLPKYSTERIAAWKEKKLWTIPIEVGKQEPPSDKP